MERYINYSLNMHASRIKTLIKEYDEKYYKKIRKIWEEAVREFIRNTVIDGTVHVRSGMSAGSFRPLAQKVSMDFSIAGKRRKGLTDMEGNYHPELYQSVKAGMAAGRKSFKLNFGSAGRPVFDFTFDISVFQHGWHEVNWQSLQKGMDAFYAYLQENWPPYLTDEWEKILTGGIT
jgi:hypothetical protein